MSASYTYLKNSNTEVTASSSSLLNKDGGDNGKNNDSTIHDNPICAFNKIHVNKAKLSEGIIKNEAVQALSTADKIYYNPKFLTTHVKTLANIYYKQLREEDRSTNDAKIHVNKNYLVSLNNPQKLMFGCSDNKQNRGAIHINPNFFKQNNSLKDDLIKATITQNPTPSESSHPKNSTINEKIEIGNNVFNVPKMDINFGIQSKSKYKLIKNTASPTKSSPKKVDNSSKTVYFKTKYSLKRCPVGKENTKVLEKPLVLPKLAKSNFGNVKLVRRLPSEFKKLGSTKLVRKSVLQSMILARRHSRNCLLKRSLAEVYLVKKSPSKKRTNNLTFYPKGNNENNKNKYENLRNNSFKRLSKMKIVRKSLLKAQIEARNQVRKQRLHESRIRRCRVKYYLSKFKLRNVGKEKFIAEQRALLKWIKKKQGPESSKIKLKKPGRGTPYPKILKKNNQPCPFYNRFGRCKGKDKGTCSKLHDTKYISICRKLLQGECDAEDCLLSHDIRPGKMPTCHHYLAGLCKRPNCPFLHIKVNPKAPICQAFLQGFCPDVYNCLKRHEFICPKFAEKGSCPRGKCCTYPHRSPVILSKLLEDDQKPLIHGAKKLDNCESSPSSSSSNNDHQHQVSSDSAIVKNVSLEGDSNNSEEAQLIHGNKNKKKKCKKHFIKETFTRYFDITESNNNADELQENHEQKLELKDEFR